LKCSLLLIILYSKNKLFGQGAVEYLVIIGVISVIALISVSITFVALNPVDLKEKATQQELKELGLSIIETSFNYSTESFLLRLKNNYSSRVTIKNIKIGDINSNFDQNLLS
jgi:Na+/melibiose symporter-like transporter